MRNDIGMLKINMFGRKKRRKQNFKVNTRLGSSKKTKIHHLAVFIVFLATISAVVLTWLGINKTIKLLFSQNDRFTITNLEIKSGKRITSTLIREYTGVKEGVNLFSFNIKKIRQEFLKKVPNVRSVNITRHLPGTLSIEIFERIPIASLRGYLAVDGDGFIFLFNSKYLKNLPIITGYRNKKLKPGDQVDGMALYAINVLNANDNPNLNIDIKSINVRRNDYLTITFMHAEKVKTLKLSWKNMKKGYNKSQKHLFYKLNKFSDILKKKESIKHTKFDATYDGKIYGQ